MKLKNYTALQAQIYLITNSFGGRQARKAEAILILLRVQLSNEKISKKQIKPAAVPAFIKFR
jgi:hypothetical protein